MKFRALFFSVLALATSATIGKADPVTGGDIIANGGEVWVTFNGSDAGYDNLLFYISNPSGTIFEGHVTAPGSSYDLGWFASGTDLIFGLNNQMGNTWYTGPASANSDGIAHARVDGSVAGQVSVGFEDLPGGGDLDYNDLQFTVSNAHVPDNAVTLLLLGGASIGLATFGRRFRRR
ncbi:MAG TPA: DUF4114 domain-containing protein [Candidatus Didemnitutus sp.]|nr:DUF4114 domain-containing protein [Candidatus Didemnitutus sp.]